MEGARGVQRARKFSRRCLLLAGVGMVSSILAGCAGGNFRATPGFLGGNSTARTPFDSKPPSKSPAKTSWWNRLFAKKERDDSPKTIQDFMKLKRVTP